MEFIYKICGFVLTCLNFSHLLSPFHLMQYTYRDVFSVAQEFSNLLILMPFSASAVVLFRLYHISKTFPFEGFFHPGKQKQKATQGEIG